MRRLTRSVFLEKLRGCIQAMPSLVRQGRTMSSRLSPFASQMGGLQKPKPKMRYRAIYQVGATSHVIRLSATRDPLKGGAHDAVPRKVRPSHSAASFASECGPQEPIIQAAAANRPTRRSDPRKRVP